jgi:beta-carotene 3-hydroxylase
MEGVAWFTHKYIMHGLLWSLHRDHHEVEPGWWERNDFFFLIFAIPGMTLIYFGVAEFDLRFWIGAGITVYGSAYFFIHDIFIHQRFRWLRKTTNPYLLAIRKAHKLHHKRLDKHDGVYFGMLWPSKRLIQQASEKLTQE